MNAVLRRQLRRRQLAPQRLQSHLRLEISRIPLPQLLRKILPAALAVYPEAADKGVEVTEGGLVLKPARPPIAAKVAA